MYELFSHAADIGIRGYGKTMTEAFEMAAVALTAVVTDPQNVTSELTFKIHLVEKDPELLFLDWINSLIYEMDTKKVLFSEFHLSLEGSELSATIKGEKVNRSKHDPAVDVKGATFTELKVIEQNNHWIAQCVVDV